MTFHSRLPLDITGFFSPRDMCHPLKWCGHRRAKRPGPQAGSEPRRASIGGRTPAIFPPVQGWQTRPHALFAVPKQVAGKIGRILFCSQCRSQHLCAGVPWERTETDLVGTRMSATEVAWIPADPLSYRGHLRLDRDSECFGILVSPAIPPCNPGPEGCTATPCHGL